MLNMLSMLKQTLGHRLLYSLQDFLMSRPFSFLLQNSRDYRCDVCKSTFRFSWDLKRHMRHIHNLAVTTTSKSDDSDVTPVTLEPRDDDETVLFVCGECHVTFPSSEELERHANEDHQVDAKEKTFKDEEDHKAAAVEVRIM